MLAIIPARGGSKGLPGKNLKNLSGKPLIAYTIEAALNSKYVDRVIVNTDDKLIANISRQYGAEIPFFREKILASDNALAIDVYIDTIKKLGLEFSRQPFMVLLPTVPFRTSKNIDEACTLFYKKRAKTLVSMVQADVPASWYFFINKTGFIHTAGYGLKNGNIHNRQDNIVEYIPNGAIYILDYNLLKEKRTYYCEQTISYIMSKKESIDIDTQDDFEYAEFIMQKKKNMERNK